MKTDLAPLDPTSAPLGVGLLGLGRHGRRYANHLIAGEVPGARLAAFWRRDTTRGAADAEALGVPLAETWAALLARPDVDLVVAAVPAALHLPLARAVAEAQRPLLLEKPLAPDRETARAILELFADRPLMVAQTLRFDPLIAALKAHAADAGALVGFALEQRLEPRGLPWEDDPTIAGGGVLLQTAIHEVDTLRFVSGAETIDVVSAALSRVRTRRAEDHGVLTLRADGALGTVVASKIGFSRQVRFELFYQRADLVADLVARTLHVFDEQGARLEQHAAVPTVARALSAFVAHLRDSSSPNPVPGQDAERSLAVIDDAYRAARQG